MYSIDLHLSLLHAKIRNLKFSSVMTSYYHYAKVRTLEFSSVMYSIDLQLSLLHAKNEIWNFKV